jgi:predicted Zn-dependent protease
MNLTHKGFLGVAFAALVVTAPARAKEEENPYPHGKAEFDAPRIEDILELFRRAERYRADCEMRAADGRPLREIEHSGREAKNWYRAALEREPSNAYATLCIGFVDLTIGRAASNRTTRANYFASAMSRFKEAVEKRPGYAAAHLYMAQVHALRGEYPEAEKNLRVILNSGIEDSHIHAWMAFVLARTDRKAEAKKHIDRAIELDNPSPAAQWARANQDAVKGK